MLEDLITSLTNINDIIPSDEDVERLINNVKNNKMDFYDMITLQQLRLCSYILNSKGERI